MNNDWTDKLLIVCATIATVGLLIAVVMMALVAIHGMGWI